MDAAYTYSYRGGVSHVGQPAIKLTSTTRIMGVSGGAGAWSVTGCNWQYCCPGGSTTVLVEGATSAARTLTTFVHPTITPTNTTETHQIAAPRDVQRGGRGIHLVSITLLQSQFTVPRDPAIAFET